MCDSTNIYLYVFCTCFKNAFSLFSQYIEELLRNGQSMEFFLEGGRSRSGKSLSPKAGLLSVIKETLCSGMEGFIKYF